MTTNFYSVVTLTASGSTPTPVYLDVAVVVVVFVRAVVGAAGRMTPGRDALSFRLLLGSEKTPCPKY